MLSETLGYRFSKASCSYQDNCAVQKRMAQRLVDCLPQSCHFGSVLEIGCGTGNLSQLVMTRLRPEHLCLNDLSEGMIDYCRQRFGQPHNIVYSCGDILKTDFDGKFDLIISNAVFQWIDDKLRLFKKLSSLMKENALLLYSDFLPDNFKEIKSVTGCSLPYTSNEDELDFLRINGFNARICDTMISVKYKDPLTLLRSFRKQGVSGLSKSMWTKGRLDEFVKEYEQRFSAENGDGVFLTWHPRYVVAEKRGSAGILSAAQRTK